MKMVKVKMSAEQKVAVYEGMKKLVIEVLVEVISGVIAKLVSGGRPGSQPEPA